MVNTLTRNFALPFINRRAAEVLEKPNYSVLKKLPMAPPSRGSVEIRKYEPYLIAETTVDESSMREAGRQGFGKCAGYIFGKNQPRTKGNESEKMAMTAPVRSVGDAGEKMAMTSPVRSAGGSSGKTKISNLQNIRSKIVTLVLIMISSILLPPILHHPLLLLPSLQPAVDSYCTARIHTKHLCVSSQYWVRPM